VAVDGFDINYFNLAQKAGIRDLNLTMSSHFSLYSFEVVIEPAGLKENGNCESLL